LAFAAASMPAACARPLRANAQIVARLVGMMHINDPKAGKF
jgi:hypothetical protein